MQQPPWPFIAAEAIDAGMLTFRELRRFHEAVYPGVGVPRGVDLSPGPPGQGGLAVVGPKGCARRVVGFRATRSEVGRTRNAG